MYTKEIFLGKWGYEYPSGRNKCILELYLLASGNSTVGCIIFLYYIYVWGLFARFFEMV